MLAWFSVKKKSVLIYSVLSYIQLYNPIQLPQMPQMLLLEFNLYSEYSFN